MHGSPDSLTVRSLRRLSRWVCDYSRWWIYPQLALGVLAVFYTVGNLEFSTNRSDLVGADKQYHRNFLKFKEEFRAHKELVTVVESESMEKNRQFVERLGARLQLETNLFSDILYNNDVKMLGNKALLFFPTTNLVDLAQTLREYRPVLDTFMEATNLTALFQLVNRQFRTAPRAATRETESLTQMLPALERIVRQAADSLERPGLPPSPGITALFDAREEAEQRIYLTFAEGRIWLLTTRPRAESVEKQAVRRLRELVEQIRLEVPGVNAAITGESVLEFDEMAQSQRDTTVAGVLAFGLVALIFIYGYQESGRPLKAVASLLVGVAYTMAFTTAAIGHLNILTITFVPMLVGLAIDFGVHLVTRYEEELRHGHPEREALELAMVPTGQGIFTGCFTTAGAFFAMGLTEFKGIQEMGIICGGGLLICLVPMMTLLPALLLRGRQNVLDHHYQERIRRRARFEQLWLNRPWLVIGLTVGISIWAWDRSGRVGFDYNLLNLQTQGLPAVEYEKKLIRSAEKSVLYCAVITDSLEQALALEQTVKRMPTVASVNSMSTFLAEDSAAKLELVRAIKDELAGLDFRPIDPAPVEVPRLSAVLDSLQGYLGQAANATEARGKPELSAQLAGLRATVDEFRNRMWSRNLAEAGEQLGRFQRALFGDLHETFGALRSQDASGPMRIEDLPPALRGRFISRSGDFHLLQVFPRADVWQRENQEEFVGELRRGLDPGGTGYPVITGSPVQLLEYTTLLKESYEEAAGYALAAIALLVLVHFRSLICVGLALLPVGLGTLWMVGFMGVLGIHFNPANIMTLPLVIGIGVTSGIHILNRFSEEGSPSVLDKSTGKAVLISGVTTVVGFGSLIFARHQGIASLGLIMSIGTTTCMLAALTSLPALLRLLGMHGWRPTRKKPSDETTKSALGREEPR
ncbi:MAG: MMPL family transporter [Verrucomicrobia bacterium]|nr:MMPL family transporter [Verrucomicrobiota bacterium]